MDRSDFYALWALVGFVIGSTIVSAAINGDQTKKIEEIQQQLEEME